MSKIEDFEERIKFLTVVEKPQFLKEITCALETETDDVTKEKLEYLYQIASLNCEPVDHHVFVEPTIPKTLKKIGELVPVNTPKPQNEIPIRNVSVDHVHAKITIAEYEIIQLYREAVKIMSSDIVDYDVVVLFWMLQCLKTARVTLLNLGEVGKTALQGLVGSERDFDELLLKLEKKISSKKTEITLVFDLPNDYKLHIK